MNTAPHSTSSGMTSSTEHTEMKTGSIAVICGDITAALNRRPELMRLFTSSFENSYFFCPEHEQRYCDDIESMGFELTITPVNTQGMNPIHDLGYFRNIYKLLKEKRPDHVFIFHLKQILYAGLACRLLGIKYHCLFAGLGYVFSEEKSWKRMLANNMIVRILKSSLRNAATVMFQNPDDMQTFESRGILSSRSNIVVLNGSGVSLEEFPFSEPATDGPVTFLLVSRMLRDKGIPEYYQAARRLKQKWNGEVKVQLLGPFDNNPNAMDPQQIKSWDDEGIIEYLGVTDDVRPLLNQMSVFVLPSFYMEGTPKTILESLATGRAIITTTSRGCRETVDHGENGFLIEPLDSDALFEAMDYFLSNRSAIEVMGKNSREVACDRYDVNKVNRQMLDAMGIR